jgi:hypothetical protein
MSTPISVKIALINRMQKTWLGKVRTHRHFNCGIEMPSFFFSFA